MYTASGYLQYGAVRVESVGLLHYHADQWDACERKLLLADGSGADGAADDAAGTDGGGTVDGGGGGGGGGKRWMLFPAVKSVLDANKEKLKSICGCSV
jgi:hypothetical protein